MKKKITWFYTLEKGWWGDKVQSNPYLATISLMFVALLGALTGGGNTLNSWFDWNTEVVLLTTLGVVGLITVYNVGESILAAQNGKVAMLRAVVLLLGMLLAFGVGYLMAVVVLVIVAIWFVFTFLTGALAGAGSKKGTKYTLDDGTEVVRETGLCGEETFREKYGSRTFERTGYGSDEVKEV